VAVVGFMWYLTNALSDGYVTHRGQMITSANDPVNFWLLLAWPAGSVVSCAVAIAILSNSISSRTRAPGNEQ